MRKILIGCTLLAGIGTAVPMPATAQDIELQIGPDGLSIDDGRRYYSDDYRNDRRYMAGRCTENRALNKAERMGIRRARIADVGRRTIDVRGRDRYGERIYVTFGRQPNCPILS